jgi:hypothetical protein
MEAEVDRDAYRRLPDSRNNFNIAAGTLGVDTLSVRRSGEARSSVSH